MVHIFTPLNIGPPAGNLPGGICLSISAPERFVANSLQAVINGSIFDQNKPSPASNPAIGDKGVKLTRW
ncbi:hypothetical protein CPI84_06615 [Erwinia pyrifoliae]|nr:hypothetical protein CPI84_06615 [Erwinia pyrifoliae]